MERDHKPIYTLPLPREEGITTIAKGDPMKNKVKDYMRATINNYRDPITDEVDLTALAEDACDHFDAHITATTSMGFPCIDTPEEFFEWSFEVVDELDFIRLYTE